MIDFNQTLFKTSAYQIEDSSTELTDIWNEIVLAFRNTNLLRYVSGIISGLLFVLNYNLSICLVHVLF